MMKEIPQDVKELQDLVEFLNYDREILMNENKRLKSLLEENDWEKKYYEVLAKLESKSLKKPEKVLKGSQTQKILKKDTSEKIDKSQNKTKRIRVTLKSQNPASIGSPVNQNKSTTSPEPGLMKSNLDVTISKAYKTLITYEKNRSHSKPRITSPDSSFNSGRFGTPKRLLRKS